LPDFESALKPFAARNVRIVLLLPGLAANYDIPDELARRTFLRSDAQGVARLPRAGQEARREKMREALTALAARLGARTIDPMDLYCDQETCRTVDNGDAPIFRDSNHLTNWYISSAPTLDPVLKPPVAD
jgi:hypothetical protein